MPVLPAHGNHDVVVRDPLHLIWNSPTCHLTNLVVVRYSFP